MQAKLDLSVRSSRDELYLFSDKKIREKMTLERFTVRSGFFVFGRSFISSSGQGRDRSCEYINSLIFLEKEEYEKW